MFRRSLSGADRREFGQATVELALVISLVVLVVLATLQVLVVVRDAMSLSAATRAAARSAMVGEGPTALREAALHERGLDPQRLHIGRSGGTARGERVRVSATYSAPTHVPIVGRLIGDVSLRDELVVRLE